jgi:hypothetical protein
MGQPRYRAFTSDRFAYPIHRTHPRIKAEQTSRFDQSSAVNPSTTIDGIDRDQGADVFTSNAILMCELLT